MKDKTLITLSAMLSIMILEGIALYKGVDGTALSWVVGTLAGLAGYHVGKRSS